MVMTKLQCLWIISNEILLYFCVALRCILVRTIHNINASFCQNRGKRNQWYLWLAMVKGLGEDLYDLILLLQHGVAGNKQVKS